MKKNKATKKITVSGDYIEGTKNHFGEGSNPSGVFGNNGVYNENPIQPQPSPDPEPKKKWWQKVSNWIGIIITFSALSLGGIITGLVDLPEIVSYNWNRVFGQYSLTCEPTTCQTKHKDFSQNQTSLTIDKQSFEFRNGEVFFNLIVENPADDFVLEAEKISLGSLKPTEITNPDGRFYTVYFDLDLHSDSNPRPLTIQGFETLELSFK